MTDSLVFTPPRDDCPQCPANGYCDLSCVWPRNRDPLVWEGDDG